MLFFPESASWSCSFLRSWIWCFDTSSVELECTVMSGCSCECTCECTVMSGCSLVFKASASVTHASFIYFKDCRQNCNVDALKSRLLSKVQALKSRVALFIRFMETCEFPHSNLCVCVAHHFFFYWRALSRGGICTYIHEWWHNLTQPMLSFDYCTHASGSGFGSVQRTAQGHWDQRAEWCHSANQGGGCTES